MIVLPFGTGITAAFIFLFCELFLFPILIQTTSKLASIRTIRSCKEKNAIRISQFRSPIWSEGLLRRQNSHKILFFLRIALIAIPVYLETRLISDFKPIIENQVVDTAFIVKPRADWVNYQNTTGIPAVLLRDYAELAFESCTGVDSDGWVTAKDVNVSVSTHNGTIYRQPRCIEGTERSVFRLDQDMPGIDLNINNSFIPETKGPYNLTVTWYEGESNFFPPSPDRDRFLTGGRLSVITNVSVNDTNVKCFHTTYFESQTEPGQVVVDLICQTVTDSKITFFSAMNQAESNVTLTKNGLNEMQGSFESSIIELGTIEFRDTTLLNGGHLINTDLSTSTNLILFSDLNNLIRRSLYSQVNGKKFPLVDGKTRTRTILDGEFIAIAMCETVLVLSVALIVQMYTRKKYRNIPTTTDGLSAAWANYQEERKENERPSNRIVLQVSKMIENGESIYQFHPISRECGEGEDC